jgi:flagellar export protein FliJ
MKLKDQAIAMVDHRLALAQDEVTEAHKNVRAMEILEEKARDEWAEEYRKEEQKNTDEINMQRYGRF